MSSEPHSRHPKWLLLPQQLADLELGLGPSNSSGFAELAALQEGLAERQQQSVPHMLVFRSTSDAAVLHVLPLNLAVAVLQLLAHLACHDDTCLGILAAELSSSSTQGHSHGSAGSGSSGGSGSKSSSSTRVQLQWVQEPQQEHAAALSHHVQQQQQRQQWHSGLCIGYTGWLPATGTGALQHTSLHTPMLPRPAGQSTGGSRSDQQQQQQRDLGVVLGDAARSHPSLLLHVGRLLAAVAAQLPLALQPLLLAVGMSDQQLLLLLQAEASSSRCTAAALLQCLLACPAVPAAFAAALTSGGDQQQQQQQQDGDDIIMRDAVADQTTALQPLNNRSAMSTRSAAAADSSRHGKAQQQQQPAGAGSSHGDQQQQQQNQQLQLGCQAVQEVLLQLLDGFSFGLDEAFQSLQQQQQSAPCQGLPTVIFATTSSSSSRSPNRSSSSALSPGNGADAAASEPSQAWGVFELQRRSCAVFAGLLHGRQELLLQYCTDTAATAGG